MRLFGEKPGNTARLALLLAFIPHSAGVLTAQALGGSSISARARAACASGCSAVVQSGEQIRTVAGFCANHPPCDAQAPQPILRPTPVPAPRILVKLRAPLAAEVETALPLPSMTLSAGGVANARIRSFMARNSARTLRPLYPAVVRAMKQRQVSDRQLASEFRGRFAARARRLRVAFEPPDLSRTYVLDLNVSPRDLPRILAVLRADPNVEFAQQDKIISVNYTPNDPYFATSGTWGQAYDDLWGIKKTGAPAAWDITQGQGVVVAVVDTGIDYNHPDIAANVWINPNPGEDSYAGDTRGWNFFDGNNNPMDGFGHGTHVAGTIAAVGDNGFGVIGVAWKAKVMAVKGLSDQGDGFDSTLAPAIVYAVDNGADVINASWGGQGADPAIEEAIDYAYNLGAVFVAAAGNSAENADGFSPADLWNVITVAASDPNDAPAGFSNWGNKVDVAAPGVDILSLQAAGTSMGDTVSVGYTRASGTSMAAPHVSGLAALILARHPEYSNEDVRQALRVSADSVFANYANGYGYGRIDASAAVAVTGVLEVKIEDPADGITAQAPVTISGIARGSGFASYKLEAGMGASPASWTVLQAGAAPVSGAIGVFDASNVPNGTYTVRLTAYNTSGQAFVDRIQLVAAPVALSSPGSSANPTGATAVKPGATIQIVGATVSATFQRFQVEWAEGINPSSGWNTTGITITGGGSTPVANGVLATWATSPTATEDYYTIRLKVMAATYTTTLTAMVYLQPALLSSNWPQLLDQQTLAMGGAVPAKNAGGGQRLAVSGFANASSDSILWTLAMDAPAQAAMLPQAGDFFQPAAANLDGGPEDQIVVPNGNAVWVLHSDGSLSSFGPQGQIFFMNNQVVIEDLEGDSRWETIAVGDAFFDQVAYVYAWRPDGTLSGNFPVQIGDQTEGGVVWPSLRFFAGDVDGDGQKEIVVEDGLSPSTYTLRLISHDGSPRPWNAPVLNGSPLALAAADLDHNGRLETILVSSDGNQTTLHVFQPDGSERTGWPFVVPNLTEYNQCWLAAADLNHNGREEIVLSTYTGVTVFNNDGTLSPGPWPVTTVGGPVAIGDVDGDGFPEIVTTRTDPLRIDPSTSTDSDLKLIAFHGDGSEAQWWRLSGMNGCYPEYGVPTIGDFNQDGITEIAVSYYVVCPEFMTTVVTVLSTGAAFHPSVNTWPVLFQNSRNTGVIEPVPVPALFTLSGSPAQTVSAGSTAIYTISITPSPAPYNYAVTSFRCTGLPTGAACAFNPASVTPGAGVVTMTLTLTTTSRTLAMAQPRGHFERLPFAVWLGFGALGFAGLTAVFPGRKRKKRLPLAVLLAGAAFAAGCGSSSHGNTGPQLNPNGTPAGFYTITVTATGNAGINRTTAVSLTVN